jgi:hypothetical protein
MFRYTTIIRENLLHLAKVILMLKHLVKLRRYILCCDVAARHRAACVLCAGQHTTHTPSAVNLPDDGRIPKHVGAIIMHNSM